jgi:hypothetical protein
MLTSERYDKKKKKKIALKKKALKDSTVSMAKNLAVEEIKVLFVKPPHPIPSHSTTFHHTIHFI